MATVITNLLSAIPWIGVDFVEFQLLITLIILQYVLNNIYLFKLENIGNVNIKGLRGQKVRSNVDKNYAFLSMFMGLVDGDGYISIMNSKGYIRLQLIISLHISELGLLNHIQSVLKIGRINTYPNLDTVKNTISKTDLQEILFPLIIHHNLFFLTNTRRSQFDLALYILNNNLNIWKNIPDVSIIPFYNKLPNTAEGYFILPFFLNWIVGFTISEGSFFIKKNGDFCYSLRQRSHKILFEAFKIVFKTNVKISNDMIYASRLA